MSENANNLPAELEKKDVIHKFFDLEGKKIEIDKIRQKNLAKELEISSQTSVQAAQNANKQLDNEKLAIEGSLDVRKLFINKTFWLVIVAIISLVGLTIFMTLIDRSLIQVMLSYVYDLLKFVAGGVIGYLIHAVRKKKNQNH